MCTVNHQSETLELRIQLPVSDVNLTTTADIVIFLHHMKAVITDHMVLIYVNNKNATLGIDAFIHHSNQPTQYNRALIRTMTQFNSNIQAHGLLIIQTVSNTESPNQAAIKPEKFAALVADLRVFDIITNDIIVMGTKHYFSFQENEKAWRVLQAMAVKND